MADAPAAPLLKVMVLATYFPKPGNTVMGTWALSQAQALHRCGMDVRVVSLTSWVPRLAAYSRGAKAFATCPATFAFGDLPVEYPRWLYYQVGFLKRWARRHPLAPLRLGWLSAKRSIARSLARWRPDVILAHHVAVNGYVAAQVRRHFGIPFLVAEHDFDEVRDCARFPERRRVYDEVLRAASLVVGIANRMQAEIHALFPGAPVRVIHQGIDPVPEEILRSPRPPELAGRLVVSSAGMFYERKDFPLLIRAFSRVSAKHPRAVLRIVGDGRERERIVQTIRDTGMQDRVTLLGLLPHDQVMRELVWSDVFALVGWDEPFATVFIEAAATGTPMIMANDGGFNDVFRSGVHGLTVRPRSEADVAQALDRLLSNEEERQAMGRNARALWEAELSWDQNARALREELRKAALA